MNRIKRLILWPLPRSRREALIGLPFLLLVAAGGYYYLLDREPIISAVSEVQTPVVEQGGIFRLRYSVEWSNRCHITGYRFIVDGAGYRHERFVDRRYVDEGQDNFQIAIRVPLAAAPGPAEYRGEVQFECNFIQRIWPLRRTLTVRPFEIAPGEPAAGGLTFEFEALTDNAS